MPIQHFTPYDLNWAVAPPPGAGYPPNLPPVGGGAKDCATIASGSIIECENQVLGEDIPIANTPFLLHYRSETQNGYHPTILIPITDSNTPPSVLDHAEVEINLAGQRHLLSIPASSLVSNQTISWAWDRNDAYGRPVAGSVTATVVVRYVYPLLNLTASMVTPFFASFGDSHYPTGVSGNRSARTFTAFRSYTLPVGPAFDDRPLGLGGWTINVQHVYESRSGMVWMGDGKTQKAGALGDAVTTAYISTNGTGGIRHIAVAGDGTILAAHPDGGNSTQWYVMKIDRAGVGTQLSGGSWNNQTFADGAAISSVFVDGTAVALNLDGSAIVTGQNRIMRVDNWEASDRSGPTTLLAGRRDGVPAYGAWSPDGPAVNVALNTVGAVAVSPDGSIVFAESIGSTGETKIRKVRLDRQLETLADGQFGTVHGIAIKPDGSIYFATESEYKVYQLGATGTVTIFAGTGTTAGACTSAGDGGPATAATFGAAEDVSYHNGALVVADRNLQSIRRIDAGGYISTIAGNHVCPGTYTSGGLATGSLGGLVYSATYGPDGLYIVVSVSGGTAVLRTGPAVDSSPSGGDEVFQFNTTPPTPTSNVAGQLQAILTRYRGKTRYTFGYDPSSGFLTNITDAGGNQTTIDYSSSPIKIQAPFGPTSSPTQLTLTDGYLTQVTDPSGASWHMQYQYAGGTANGLLTQLTDPNGQVHTFTWSGTGLLINDKNPMIGSSGTRLTHSYAGVAGWSVAVTSPQNRTTTHVINDAPVTSDPNRIEERTHTNAVGLTSTEDWYSDGSRKVTLPDGRISTTSYTPDPRFGFDGAYVSKSVSSNGSKSVCVSTSRQVSGQSGPFSFSTETDTTSLYADTTCTSTALATATRLLDATNSTITYTSFAGRQTKVWLDATDRVTQIQLQGNVPGQAAAMNPIVIQYDDTTGRGRIAEIDLDSSGTRKIVNTYGSTGNLNNLLSSVAITGLGTTSYPARDAAGRPTQITLPGGRNVFAQYDGAGNTTTIQMPLNSGSSEEHDFTPNPINLLSTYSPPNATSPKNTSYAYDLDGLLTSENQPSAGVRYQYDGAGRMTSLTMPDPALGGDLVNAYTYDENGYTGRLTSASTTRGNGNSESTLSYAYDGTMITSEAFHLSSPNVTHTVHNSYDSRMRLSTQDIDNVATFTFTYDRDDLVTSVVANGVTYALTRDTTSYNGMLSAAAIGSTVTEAYTYDPYGAPSSYTVNCNGNACYTLSYTRDSGGRVHGKTEFLPGAGTCATTYTYDSNNFLQQASYGGFHCSTSTRNYNYDADGSPFSNKGSGTWSYDTQNRLTSDGTFNWTYSTNGEVSLQTSGSRTIAYSYDALSDLRYFSDPASGVTRYDYVVDAKNRRLFRTGVGGNGSHGWLYDGERIIGELDSSGNLLSHFAYATKSNVPDLMLRLESGNWHLYRIISDAVGSPRALVCAQVGGSCATVGAGGLAEYNYTYADDFGAATSAPSLQPFGFAGGLVDLYPGILRFGARDYSGWQKRWMSKDPIRFSGGLNFYNYCANDPVNCADPLGLNPGDPYDSMMAAASAALRQYGTLAQQNNVEAGGWITLLPNGKYSYTYPLFSSPDVTPDPNVPWNYQVKPEFFTCPTNQKIVSKYHSHPLDGALTFSRGDLLASDAWNLAYHLGALPSQFLDSDNYTDFMLNGAGHMMMLQGRTRSWYDYGNILHP